MVIRFAIVLAAVAFVPSAHAVDYYISPVGVDGNTGMSLDSPWPFSRMSTASFAGGDTINLDTMHGPLYGCPRLDGRKFATAPDNRVVVQPYGGGYRAQISSNCGVDGSKTPALLVDGVNGITFRRVIVHGNGMHTLYGFWLRSWYPQTQPFDVWLDDVETVDFNTSKNLYDTYSVHVLVDGLQNGGTPKITNTVMHGLTRDAFDDNGVTGYGDNVRSAVYSGNTVYFMGGRPNVKSVSGNGIIANGVHAGGAQLDHNVVHDMAWNQNQCGGPSGVWAYTSDRVAIEKNFVYNMKAQPSYTYTGCDRTGYDLDGGVTNSVLRYNYSLDNDGPGYLMFPIVAPWGPNTVEYNVSVNDAKLVQDLTSGAIAWSGYGGASSVVTVRYNHVFNSFASPATNNRPACFGMAGTVAPASGSQFTNNVCQMTMDKYGFVGFLGFGGLQPDMTFDNNVYQMLTGGRFQANRFGPSYDWSGWQALGKDLHSVNR